MIPAKPTLLGVWFFRCYARWMLHRHFREIRYRGQFQDRGKAILLIANHFTWWDGFIQGVLNQNRFQRNFYVMMLEEQLRKFPILRTTGAFSIRKHSRSMLESLSYCRELLQNPNHLVVVFPQGELQSMHLCQFTFQQGLARILKENYHRVQLIMNVNLIDYQSNKKPSLTLYFKEQVLRDENDIHFIENQFNDFYQQCRHTQCQF